MQCIVISLYVLSVSLTLRILYGILEEKRGILWTQ